MKNRLIALIGLIFLVSCSSSDNEINNSLKDDLEKNNILINSLNNSLLDFYTGDLSGLNVNSYTTMDYGKSSNSNIVENNINKTAFNPFIQQVTNLLNSEGISDKELLEDFGALDSDELLFVGLFLIENPNFFEDIESGGFTLNGRQDVVDCVLKATGITGLKDAFFGNYRNKRIVIKAIGKIGGRLLGWAGTIYAAYEFMECMGVFSLESEPSDITELKKIELNSYLKKKKDINISELFNNKEIIKIKVDEKTFDIKKVTNNEDVQFLIMK